MASFSPAIDFNLPLSGAVKQNILPWTWMFNPTGSQIGLINISLGHSADPTVEQRVLDEVGSYGRQIGQIGDALGVLLKHLDRSTLTPAEQLVLEKLEDQLDRVELLISDVVMPNLDGPSLAAQLRTRRPDLKILFISGYAEDSLRTNMAKSAHVNFLPKPFSLSQLAGKVKEVMDSPA